MSKTVSAKRAKTTTNKQQVLDYSRPRILGTAKDVAAANVNPLLGFQKWRLGDTVPSLKDAPEVKLVLPPITLSTGDTQVGGTHYKDMSVQPWDAMQSWMTPEQFEGFLRGNVIRYMSRYDKKNGLEDVQKAQHYLNKLVEVMEGV